MPAKYPSLADYSRPLGERQTISLSLTKTNTISTRILSLAAKFLFFPGKTFKDFQLLNICIKSMNFGKMFGVPWVGLSVAILEFK